MEEALVQLSTLAAHYWNTNEDQKDFQKLFKYSILLKAIEIIMEEEMSEIVIEKSQK